MTWNENVIAADDRGNIGYWHPGLHQLRPRGYDERLPYPGTGEAEWRGFLAPDRRPQVVNPRQGFLFQWNNVPSVGWTSGDGPARERLERQLPPRALAAAAGQARGGEPELRALARDRPELGHVAQQFPFARRKLRKARRLATRRRASGARRPARWDGSYHRTYDAGLVHEGVAIWEELKDRAEAIALGPLGGELATDLLSGGTGSSHAFDASNAEAYALRTLTPRELAARGRRRRAGAHQALRDPASPASWREPRRMYDVAAQGAAASPELPFFDRGTWEQSVALGP